MSPAIHEGDALNTLAVVIGLCVAALGTVGLVAPAVLVSIAEHTGTAGAFYVIAAVRVAVGLVLISAAAASRAPKAIRILGYIIVAAGLATALIALLAMGPARAIIDWWLQQGSGLVRLTGLLVLVVGGVVAYACARPQRTA